MADGIDEMDVSHGSNYSYCLSRPYLVSGGIENGIQYIFTMNPLSGVAKVGNGWAQAQPIMSSAQPIFMSIVQPIYAPFHVKIYNK